MEITTIDQTDCLRANVLIPKEELLTKLPAAVREEVVRRLADKIIAEHGDDLVDEIVYHMSDDIAKVVADELKKQLSTPVFTVQAPLFHPATKDSL